MLRETSVLINRILFITSFNKYLHCCSLPTINRHYFIFFYLKKNCKIVENLKPCGAYTIFVNFRRNGIGTGYRLIIQ
jgi:hypothetical protein